MAHRHLKAGLRQCLSQQVVPVKSLFFFFFFYSGQLIIINIAINTAEFAIRLVSNEKQQQRNKWCVCARAQEYIKKIQQMSKHKRKRQNTLTACCERFNVKSIFTPGKGTLDCIIM